MGMPLKKFQEFPRKPEAGWTLKATPNHFHVDEVLYPSSETSQTQNFTALLLKKIGITTFQAIELLARLTDTKTSAWSYAGLKDEDGITTQTVVLNAILSREDIQGIQTKVDRSIGDEALLALDYVGPFASPLNAGELVGNVFSILLDDVSNEHHLWLEQNERRTIHFINYYDTQRFGFPGYPKYSHIIGELLNDGLYHAAYNLYVTSCPKNQQEAKSDRESFDDFFDHLPLHRKAFYLSSWHSSLWNRNVARLLPSDGKRSIDCKIEGLHFRFGDEESVLSILARNPLMAYVGFRAVENKVLPFDKMRPTTIATNYSIRKRSNGSTRIVFFLPMGCYATMFVKQLHTMCCQCHAF